MKKLYISLCLLITAVTVYAQEAGNKQVEDIALAEIVSPAPGSTLIPGNSYNFNIKVTNVGSSFPCACFDYYLVVGTDTVKGGILTISFFDPGDTVEITTSNMLTISPGNNGNAVCYLSGVNDVNQNNDTLFTTYSIQGFTDIAEVRDVPIEVDIYTNPNGETLIFKMANNTVLPDKLMLYNITGTLVKEYGGAMINHTTHMDIMDLPKGIYIAVVNSGGKTHSKKVAIY